MSSARSWTHNCILALAIGWAGAAFAGGQTGQSAADSSLQPNLYPVPVLFFTPETGMAGGAAALLLFRGPMEARTSSLSGDAIYTAKRQIIVELGSDLYFRGDQYRLQSGLSFKKYPNKYYGIGNNTALGAEEEFTPQVFSASFRMDMNLFSRFHAGPLLKVETLSMKETTPTGKLVGGAVPGSRGGTSVGVGVVANWDSRDNTFAAADGSLCQLVAMAFRTELGSSYNYTCIQLDARKYYEAGPGGVLAVQATAQSLRGTVPFQSLTTFGGANLLRGYYEGRYRDNDGVAFQAEYRVHVWWRLGLAGFVGVAQVADRIDRFALNRFWCAGGLGARFEWNPEERVNFRLDYGIGNNSSGMYVTVTEAI